MSAGWVSPSSRGLLGGDALFSTGCCWSETLDVLTAQTKSESPPHLNCSNETLFM